MFVSCYFVFIAVGFVLFRVSFVSSWCLNKTWLGFFFTSNRSSDWCLRVPSMGGTEFNDDFS